MLRRFVIGTGTLLAAPFVAAATAMAQTGVLSGAVFANSDRTGVEGATVTIAGTTLSAVTGKDGRFTIANVPAGDQELRIRRSGYVAQSDRVRIAAADTTHGYYALTGVGEEGSARLSVRTSEGGLLIVDGVIASPVSDQKPLIIIDGVIMPDGDTSMKGLDPKQIESVEVIKGEAAAAAYGSRGVNGVISITTKPRPPQR